MRQGNVDGLSQRECSYCKQCQLIEQKDGGPSRQQVEHEESRDINRISTQTPGICLSYSPAPGTAANTQVPPPPSQREKRDGFAQPRELCLSYSPAPRATASTQVSPTFADIIKTTYTRSPYTAACALPVLMAKHSASTPIQPLAPVKRVSITASGLASEQARGNQPVAILYRALRDYSDLTWEQIELGSAEVKRLYAQRDSIRI